ncbi:histone deacetylase complex subunit SAP25 isoform X3 [Lynx rufus]|uniref:histone deacetylase complex subunit SAP25 isoform X3 n=1 Tax=Lynx rufus TaxID=61384 RepID=UPI001F124961|nr:histone deacetylase complex subunit SAP25 isoform X3 [Lynx rufus]
MLGFCSSPHRAPPLHTQRLPSAGPATPAARGRPRDPGGSARHVVRKRAGRRRGREAPRAGRGAAGGEGREGAAWGCEGRGGRHGRCGHGHGAAGLRCPPPPEPSCCLARLGGGTRAKSRRSRNMAPRLAVTPGRPRPLERKPWRSQELPRRTGEGLGGREVRQGAHSVRRSPLPTLKNGCAQTPCSRHPRPCPGSTGGGCDRCTSVPPAPSPQPRSRRPSWTRRELLLSRPPPGLAADHSPGTPVALSPQMAWEVAPSRMTVLAPWDPNYKAKAGPGLVWGPSCAPGTSFSGRTLCHPSLWPLYEAASDGDLRPLAPATGHQNGEHEPRDAGFPVMCCEDVFVSDPLLPCGQRIPLYLSEASQQVMGSLKLLLPPPIMSPWVLRTPSPGCPTAWLSGPELIALTGLLQMSQGPPRPVALEAPTPPAGPPDPVSDHPDPSGDPSCSHCTDPSAPQTPDTH